MRKYKGKIGIYLIYNHCNDKVYVGQSWNIEHRWKEHKTMCSNIHLKGAFHKYGMDGFSFLILRELHENDLTQILLDSLEQKYINQYHSMNPALGYNMRSGGARGKHNEESIEKNKQAQLGRKQSEETKKKISISNKGHKPPSKESLMRGVQKRRENGSYVVTDEKREKLRLSHMGKKLSEESIKKRQISRRKNGWYKDPEAHRIKFSIINMGRIVSKETKLKQSIAAKNRCNNTRKLQCQI